MVEEHADAVLEKILREIYKHFKTTSTRTVPHSEGYLQCLKEARERIGILSHITYDVPGEGKLLSPKPGGLPETDTSIMDPPTNSNFMKSELFFLVHKNDLLICPSGHLRAGSVPYYLNKLIHKFAEDTNRVLPYPREMSLVANMNKLQMIRDEKVSEIDLGLTLYQASQLYMDNKNNQPDSAFQLFNLLHFKDEAEQAALRDIPVRIVVKNYPKRSHLFGKARDFLTFNSEVIVDNNNNFSEDFTIRTMNNNTITADEIKVSKKVYLLAKGESVNRNEAFGSLLEHCKELIENGQIEE